MRYLFVLLLCVGICYADETVPMTADGSPLQWTSSGGTQWEAMNTTSGEFIESDGGDGGDDTSRFVIDATTHTTIDTVRIRWRARRDGLGNPTVKIRIKLGGSFSDGTTRTLGFSNVYYNEPFVDAPGSSGWTQAQFGLTEVEVVCLTNCGDDAQVTYIEANVIGSAPAAGAFIIITGD